MKSIKLIAVLLTISTTLYAKQADDKLLGSLTRADLNQSSHSTWVNAGYENYHVKNIDIETEGIEIRVFFGSWCGDSRRELPRLLKVMDSLGFDQNQLQLIAVDNTIKNYKQSPEGQHEGLSIYRVPTFIVYKNGKILNRIIEEPVKSLEEDLKHIINNDTYQPQYNFSFTLDQKLANNAKFLNQKRTIIDAEQVLMGQSELTSYAYSKFAVKDYDKAKQALIFNTKVYPKYSRSYSNLGMVYLALNKKKEALRNYKKALKLDPESDSVKKRIAEIEN